MHAMSDYEQQRPMEQDVRRHTGSVGLLVSGRRPEPKGGAEIAAIGREVEFFEEGSVEREYRGASGEAGSIRLVPRTLVPNATYKALMVGLLLYKFTITGTPPRELQRLDPDSTYYTFLDFIEGPDFEEGRWIARIVDGEGNIRYVCLGCEVKELIRYHVDHRPEHARPSIYIHGLGLSEDAFGDTALEEDSGGWDVHDIDWSDFGPGCKTTSVCLPGVA
jgi:hypothetical protein